MSIIELKERQDLSGNDKVNRIYSQVREFLTELKKRQLPSKIAESINKDIDELNFTTLTGDALRRLVKQKQTKIIKLVEKELKITPKNYYRSLWLVLGMSLGSGIGAAFGISTRNMALMGIGVPLGMVIGMAVGIAMDKKAFKEGRQLDVEVKY